MSSQQPPPASSLPITKRRRMLYKAIAEFPQNQQIRSALLRTYSTSHIQTAAKAGVFISYNRADELFALELDQGLRDIGVNIWLDEIDVADNEDWHHAISSALARCGVMIVILSPQSVDDESVQDEMRSFVEAGKIILPVMSEACDLADLNLFLPAIRFDSEFSVPLSQLCRAFGVSRRVHA